MEKTIKMKSDNLMKFVRDNYQKYNKVSWNGIELTIKESLSFSEMMSFVDSVTKLCFAEETGAYLPEVKDFGIKTYILEKYACIDINRPADELYELIYNSDLVYFVIGHVNGRQLDEIVQSIEAKVKHLSDAKIDAITKQMSELYDAFDNLEKQLEDIFSGISPDDMSKIVGAISGGTFDDSRLLKAYQSEMNKGNK